MTAEFLGPRSIRMTRDAGGHRDYKVKYLVKTSVTEGPFTALSSSGLPVPGDQYQFGDEFDQWATCLPTTDITVHQEKEGDPNRYWLVECLFSTKPPDGNNQRCNDQPIEDPILEPPKISGSYTRYSEEKQYDRFGTPIQTSSFERILGQQSEFDGNRASLRIEQNVSTFEQAVQLPAAMANTVNDRVLWGLPPRTIKLMPSNWERKYHGHCDVYYSRTLEFDIRTDTFDKDLIDESQKVLNGHWGDGIGTGCTINIQAVNAGGITDVLLVSAGTGYQRNATVQLGVAGGTGGVITVKTDTSGTVVKIEGIYLPGSGYVVSTPVATTSRNGWVLDNIDGLPPDRNKPEHFIRFQDRKGNPTKVLLNGKGVPSLVSGGIQPPAELVGTVAAGGSLDTDFNYFYKVTAINSSGETTPSDVVLNFLLQPVPDGIEIAAGSQSIVLTWKAVKGATSYRVYRAQSGTSTLYRHLSFEGADVTPTGENTETVIDDGVAVPDGTQPPTTNGTIYSSGGPGNIHVEFYEESNFLLLGIPAEF